MMQQLRDNLTEWTEEKAKETKEKTKESKFSVSGLSNFSLRLFSNTFGFMQLTL